MIIKTDLIGKKFNKLTVIEPIPREIGERTRYKCKCDCGKEKNVEGSKLKNNHTKSCGCIRKEVDHSFNRLAEGVANRNRLVDTYKHNARRKGIKFNLTNEKMIDLFKSNCYYCGKEPYTIMERKGANGNYVFTGIDRKDNDPNIGYCIENVVPCCSKCNYIKNKMNHDEFLDWIEGVFFNLKEKKVI